MFRLTLIYLKEFMKFTETFENKTKAEMKDIIKEYHDMYRLIYVKYEPM